MIFDLLTMPRTLGGGAKIVFAVAQPIHVSNTHTEYGWISSNGLGGDSITVGRVEFDFLPRSTRKSHP